MFLKFLTALTTCQCVLAGIVFAQTSRYTLAVTYYDYHADNSNLEFGVNTSQLAWLNNHGGLWKGLVLNTLDADKKIVKNPAITDPTFSVNHIDKWFRPWTHGDTIKFFRPADTLLTINPIDTTITPFVMGVDTLWYDTAIIYDTTTHFITADTSKSDTTFKNFVFQGSLAFSETAQGSGIFVFGGSARYYPLDGKGFGNEHGSIHNDCFAMELSNRFTYHSGQKLAIGSDDDSWAFINGHLAIDVGGLHGFTQDSASLDTMGLTEGQQYDIQIFWAERCQGGCLFVQSNLAFTDTTPVAVTPQHLINRSARTLRANWIGTVLELDLPRDIAKAQVSVFNTKGEALVTRQVTNGVNSTAKLATGFMPVSGTYMVRARCYDVQGNFRTTLTSRLIQVGRKAEK